MEPCVVALCGSALCRQGCSQGQRGPLLYLWLPTPCCYAALLLCGHAFAALEALVKALDKKEAMGRKVGPLGAVGGRKKGKGKRGSGEDKGTRVTMEALYEEMVLRDLRSQRMQRLSRARQHARETVAAVVEELTHDRRMEAAKAGEVDEDDEGPRQGQGNGQGQAQGKGDGQSEGKGKAGRKEAGQEQGKDQGKGQGQEQAKDKDEKAQQEDPEKNPGSTGQKPEAESGKKEGEKPGEKRRR